jgi:hypothetical protein
VSRDLLDEGDRFRRAHPPVCATFGDTKEEVRICYYVDAKVPVLQGILESGVSEISMMETRP